MSRMYKFLLSCPEPPAKKPKTKDYWCHDQETGL